MVIPTMFPAAGMAPTLSPAVVTWVGGFLSDLLSIIGPLSILVTLVTTAILGILVAYKNPGASINRVFAAWMGVSAINSLFLLFYNVVPWQPLFLFSLLVGLMDPCFALNFALLFTGLRPKGRLARSFYLLPYIPFFIAVALLFAAFLVEGRHLIYELQFLVLVLYLTFMYLAVLISLVLVARVAFITRSRGDPDKAARERNQARYIFAGILLMILSFVTGNLLGLGVISYVLVPASAILFAFAILKHQLMGIEVIIKKGLTYTGISLLIVVIFISLEELLENAISNHLPGGNRLFMAIASAMVVSVVVFPAHKLITGTLDRLMPHQEDEDAKRMRLGSYSTALSTALADRNVSDRELRMLMDLRKNLRISPEEEMSIALELGLSRQELQELRDRAR